MKPSLSIIIANVNGHPEITKCLSALEQQRVGGKVEVIVVERSGVLTADTLEKQFPWIRLVKVEQGSTLPEMLWDGYAGSWGECIAILEDHEIALPGWSDAVLALHNTYPDVAAIAGPIDNGCTGRILDWATFFCEYCSFMSPVQPGATESIPAHNVIYKRWALETSEPAKLSEGFWNTTLHTDLINRGCQFRMEPGLRVLHQIHFGFFEFLEQRYHYSRYFAGLRVQKRNLFFRMVYSVACIVLPFILLKRILACGFGKQRFRKELILSIPLLTCFTVVWAYGEMVGSLAGSGRSLAMIK